MYELSWKTHVNVVSIRTWPTDVFVFVEHADFVAPAPVYFLRENAAVVAYPFHRTVGRQPNLAVLIT